MKFTAADRRRKVGLAVGARAAVHAGALRACAGSAAGRASAVSMTLRSPYGAYALGRQVCADVGATYSLVLSLALLRMTEQIRRTVL